MSEPLLLGNAVRQPYGSGDMLERAYMIGYRQGLYTDEELATAFELATHAAAETLGIAGYGLQIGARANLIAITAGSVPEAVAAPPARVLVLHDGRVVMSQLPARAALE